MTKQDYELIARVIRRRAENAKTALTAAVWRQLAQDFADELARDNERFDLARFLKACGVEG